MSGKPTGPRVPLEPNERWGRLQWTNEPLQRHNSMLKVPVVCDCGEERLVYLAYLRDGTSRSCGCLRTEGLIERSTTHGLYHSRVRGIWSSMWTRCTNKEHPDYDSYGGRGIVPCDKWRTLEGFVEDMGLPPDGMTLERKDNDKGYTKENCEWATYVTQARNRRNSLWYEWKGERRHLKDLCEEFGIDYNAVYYRLFTAGWHIEKALMTPSGEKSQ